MQDIYQMILERNERETSPFVAVHESYSNLRLQMDSLQKKYEAAESEMASLRQQLEDSTSPGSDGHGGISSGTSSSTAATAAAIKNETRLRDKLEKIQEELNAKLQAESTDRAEALRTIKELAEVRESNSKQEAIIDTMKQDYQKAERVIEHLKTEIDDAKSRTQLAEQQYERLNLLFEACKRRMVICKRRAGPSYRV